MCVQNDLSVRVWCIQWIVLSIFLGKKTKGGKNMNDKQMVALLRSQILTLRQENDQLRNNAQVGRLTEHCGMCSCISRRVLLCAAGDDNQCSTMWWGLCPLLFCAGFPQSLAGAY